MDTLIQKCTFIYSILPVTLQHVTGHFDLAKNDNSVLHDSNSLSADGDCTVQRASNFISTEIDKRTHSNIWQNVNSYSSNCLYWQKWRNRKKWKPSMETGGWLATFHNAFSKAIGEIINLFMSFCMILLYLIFGWYHDNLGWRYCLLF